MSDDSELDTGTIIILGIVGAVVFATVVFLVLMLYTSRVTAQRGFDRVEMYAQSASSIGNNILMPAVATLTIQDRAVHKVRRRRHH